MPVRLPRLPRRLLAGAALVAGALALRATPAAAQTTVFSNFGSGESWSGGWGLGGGSNFMTAQFFSVSAPGALSSIRVAVFNNGFLGYGTGNALTFRLFQGPINGEGWGNTPDGGTLLETFTLAPNNGGPWDVYSLTSAARPVLTTGQNYWLIASGNGTWGQSPTASGYAYRNDTQGWYTWTSSFGGRSAAMSVAVSAVPEPATVALVASGLGALALGARRRRRVVG